MSYSTLGAAVLAVVVLAALGSRLLGRANAPAAVAYTPPLSAGPAPALVVRTLAGQPPGLSYGDGQGSGAWFNQVGAMGFDARGNLYVASGSVVRRVTPAGVVTTLAGGPPEQARYSDGSGVSVGDLEDPTYGYRDGPARQARFLAITGLAVAPDGTVFVGQQNAVRRIGPDGTVTTWAGLLNHDEGGYRDGPGQQARFNQVEGLVLDKQGNLFVADSRNNCIRRISPAGVVSTLAGKGGGYEFEGTTNGPAATARFNGPRSLALAPDGALLVGDSGNSCIRRVTMAGDVTTWAGQATNTWHGTWPGVELKFDVIQALAVDRTGTAYLIDGKNIIRRILADRSEPQNPWAGADTLFAHHDAPTPAAARFSFPSHLAIGPDGRTLYVADGHNAVIRRIAPDGQVSTFVGQPPRADVDGPAALAEFGEPSGVALGPDGQLYVADRGQHLVRRVDPATGQTSTFAGQLLAPGASFDANNGQGFYNPSAVAFGTDGTLYVADEGRGVIHKVTPQGHESIWAGVPGSLSSADAGVLGAGRVSYPISVAVGADGTVYCTERETRAVRRISPSGRIGTFVGGRSVGVSPFSNEARTYYPTAVAVGPDGSVYVLHGTLRRYCPDGSVVELAGNPNEDGYADGHGTQARFQAPTGLAVDAWGNVFVADRGNHLIRRVSPEGDVTTVAGQPGSHGSYGPDANEQHYGDHRDGPAAQARFNHPNAVAVAPDGRTLYVADMDNNCLRVIEPAR